MESIIPKAPKQKFIIPKIRPSSFSLNETDVNKILDINEFEKANKFIVYNKVENEVKNELNYLCNNSILKTLVFLNNRNISTSSIDTKESDNN